MISKPHISAIILAAGTSGRMGNVNKLRLKIKNKTVLRWTVENALRSRVNDVWVVVGIDGNKLQRDLKSLNVKILWNVNYEEGMSASIKVGIQSVQNISECALILLADQPNLKPETINRFIECYEKSHKEIIAGQYGNVIGNPVLFHRNFFQELQALKGDVGARSVLERHPKEIETVPIPEEELLDLDTPEDFENLKSFLET